MVSTDTFLFEVIALELSSQYFSDKYLDLLFAIQSKDELLMPVQRKAMLSTK